MIKPRVKIAHWKLRESEATGRKINGFLGGCQYLADVAQTDIVSHSLNTSKGKGGDLITHISLELHPKTIWLMVFIGH